MASQVAGARLDVTPPIGAATNLNSKFELAKHNRFWQTRTAHVTERQPSVQLEHTVTMWLSLASGVGMNQVSCAGEPTLHDMET